MSTTKRLVFLLIAVLIAALAATLLITSSGSDPESEEATVRSTTVAQPAATTPAPAKPVLLKAGAERTLTVNKGDTVRFRVVHPTADEVHVHGYDFTFDLEPGVTKIISFNARIDGQFEIELEKSATPLATLRVNP